MKSKKEGYSVIPELKLKRVRGTYEAVIVDGEYVLLLGDHESEAAAIGVLEGDAGSLGTEDAVDIIAVVQFVIEALWDVDGLGWVFVLDDDKVVGLEVRTPHLEEV